MQPTRGRLLHDPASCCNPIWGLRPRAAAWPVPCHLLLNREQHQQHQQQQQQQLCCGLAPAALQPSWSAAAHHPAARRRRHTTACRASPSGSSRPETACVVEYLLLLQARPGADAEELEVLLDSLWSLQYLIPSVMCAAAGTVITCTLHGAAAAAADQHQQSQQQQQQESPPRTAGNGSSSSSSSSEPQQQQQPHPGLFTHAVHFRLSSRLALEAFMAHPLMAAALDGLPGGLLAGPPAHIVFEGRVARRLEALFRRGEEFGSGVEHVLLLRPGANGGVGADAFLEQLGALAESSVAGGIQASHGGVVSCVHAAATHVLMTRFGSARQVAQLLETPACAAVLRGDGRLPVVAASSLAISIQPTEESTRVDGSGVR